ncbi:unnamed protein product [Linum trigynum]|uniref:Uncharacterized protein n=1 Tax=Linum trigynum TaxID=586398 RepID=A0AAV2EA64_9ROSI
MLLYRKVLKTNAAQVITINAIGRAIEVLDLLYSPKKELPDVHPEGSAFFPVRILLDDVSDRVYGPWSH